MHRHSQGCQMFYFQTKKPILGEFWRSLDWKMLTYFVAIWNILRTFGIFYDHLVYFVLIWYIFFGFVTVYQENLATLGTGKPTKAAEHMGTML
jgi:hypothetical protein